MGFEGFDSYGNLVVVKAQKLIIPHKKLVYIKNSDTLLLKGDDIAFIGQQDDEQSIKNPRNYKHTHHIPRSDNCLYLSSLESNIDQDLPIEQLYQKYSKIYIDPFSKTRGINETEFAEYVAEVREFMDERFTDLCASHLLNCIELSFTYDRPKLVKILRDSIKNEWILDFIMKGRKSHAELLKILMNILGDRKPPAKILIEILHATKCNLLREINDLGIDTAGFFF